MVACTNIDPRRFGIAVSGPGGLRGGDASKNAAAVHALLAGERGPVRDAVLPNAAAACATVAATGGDLDSRIAAALGRCAEAIDSGAAEATLTRSALAGVSPFS